MKFNIATAFADIEHLCSIAETAEECGYDGVAVSDHVVHPEWLVGSVVRSPLAVACQWSGTVSVVVTVWVSLG